MSQKNYSFISGIIFFIVAVVHLLRTAQGWEITFAGHIVPMSVSWLGFIVSAILAFYGLRFSKR